MEPAHSAMTASRALPACAAPEPSSARVHGLDALRGGALLLGIVLHALLPYSPVRIWLFQDVSTDAWVLPIVGTIHLFRMTLFMMLAGFFGRMMLQRRGAWPYVKDRLIRITLPIVGFWPIAVLPLGLMAVALWSVRGEEPLQPPGGDSVLAAFGPGQLWFLVVLTQAVIVTVVLREAIVRLVGAQVADGVASRAGRLLTSPGGVVLAAVAYALGVLLQGTAIDGIQAPHTVLGSLSSFVAYAGAFWVGWAVHACRRGLARLSRWWPVYLVAALLLTPVALVSADPSVPLAIGAATAALAGWTWCYGLVGFCVRRFSRERAWVRYLADASYWMYLVHLPLVFGAGALLADRPWPVIVKLAVVFGTTVPLMLGSYELLVRHTWLGRWLNGRRRPRRQVGRSV